MILRARIVLPVCTPPIDDGAVVMAGGRITAVGAWSELRPRHRGKVSDLGDVIILPGLVNAHCHLDYTDMAGQLAPTKSFTDWIKSIITLKAGWSYADFALSWLRGAKMLLRSGTTTVADIEAVSELLPEVWAATPLRVISFLELLNIKSRAVGRELVESAVARLAALPQSRDRVGLSPHSPYSTTPGLQRLAARAARQHRWPVTAHLAESEQEFEMFMYRRGPMFDWLKKQRDNSDCGHGSPVMAFEKQGLLAENFLGAHVNYLWDNDARILGRHRASVVHCPRSHAFFQHARFPFQQLQKAGVNLCLGTDSLASMGKMRGEKIELNMFSEMRALASKVSLLSPEDILRLATVNGAQALGRAGKIGVLAPKAQADLIVIPCVGKISDVFDAVLHHHGDVAASMIGGRWAVAPAAGS